MIDTVIRKIHDHTREHYNDYKLKYYDKNTILEISTPLTAYISELRIIYNNDNIVALQRYNRQDQIFRYMLVANNFEISELLKNNKYLYLLFAINYVFAEKDLN